MTSYRVVQGSKHEGSSEYESQWPFMTQFQKIREHHFLQTPWGQAVTNPCRFKWRRQKASVWKWKPLRICSHVLKPPYPSRENICHLACPSHRGEGERSFWSLHWQKENETGSLFREHTALFLSQAVRFSLWHTPELGEPVDHGWSPCWTPLQLILPSAPSMSLTFLTFGCPTHPSAWSFPLLLSPASAHSLRTEQTLLLGTMEAFVIFPFNGSAVCMRIQITLVGGAGDYLWESVRTGLSWQAGGESAAQSQECYHGEPGQAQLGSVAENTLHSCRTRQIERLWVNQILFSLCFYQTQEGLAY